MKKIISLLGFLTIAVFAEAQTTEKNNPTIDTLSKTKIVEASCGECKFGMEGTGCVLAVRIDGKPYLVEGVPGMASHGNAHAADGMCNVIRKAEVSGEIVDNKFVAKTFKLLPFKKTTD